MGRIFTFINNGKVNTKVRTERLQEYLDNGWKLGNYNQDELNKKSGAGVKRKFNELKQSGEWEEWNSRRSSKVTQGLKEFWSTVDDDYIIQREIKKQASRDNWTEEERELYHNKMSMSAKIDRATISPEEYRRRSLLMTETRKRNGTFATSSYETKCYNSLLKFYDEDDIKREYDTDERYPFACDFYIKSKDLFIELNIHPSHYLHAFNSDDENDVALLEKLKSSNNDWDYMIADVLSNRDVQKMALAKNNKLNYIVIYPKDFDNFIEDIEEGKI